MHPDLDFGPHCYNTSDEHNIISVRGVYVVGDYKARLFPCQKLTVATLSSPPRAITGDMMPQIEYAEGMV